MITNGDRIIKGLEEAATGNLVAVTINGQRWIRDRIRESDSDYRPEILETPTASTAGGTYIQVVIKIPLAELPEEMDVVQFEAELMNVIIDQGMPSTAIDSRIRAGELAPP